MSNWRGERGHSECAYLELSLFSRVIHQVGPTALALYRSECNELYFRTLSFKFLFPS